VLPKVHRTDERMSLVIERQLLLFMACGDDVMIIEMPRVHHYATYKGQMRACIYIHAHILILFVDYIHTHSNSHHLFFKKKASQLMITLKMKTLKPLLSFFTYLINHRLFVCKKKRQIPNDIINKTRISITKKGEKKIQDRKAIKKKALFIPDRNQTSIQYD
jgi:hypothetical protein